MTWVLKLSLLFVAFCLAGCPSPSSRHVFFGVSKAEPLDPPAATKLHNEAKKLWAAGPAKRDQAIEKWQMANIKDHTRSDVLIALSKAYALQHAATGRSGKSARLNTCDKGWEVSSQALELTSPKFVDRVNDDNKAWKKALSLVGKSGAEALYWYAHYDNCLFPEHKRIGPALARLKSGKIRFEPAANEGWPAALDSK